MDTVAKNGFGLRLPAYGIFEHQDMVGLEMASAVMDYVVGSLNSEARTPKLLEQRLQEGRGFRAGAAGPPGRPGAAGRLCEEGAGGPVTHIQLSKSVSAFAE